MKKIKFQELNDFIFSALILLLFAISNSIKQLFHQKCMRHDH